VGNHGNSWVELKYDGHVESVEIVQLERSLRDGECGEMIDAEARDPNIRTGDLLRVLYTFQLWRRRNEMEEASGWSISWHCMSCSSTKFVSMALNEFAVSCLTSGERPKPTEGDTLNRNKARINMRIYCRNVEYRSYHHILHFSPVIPVLRLVQGSNNWDIQSLSLILD
jgi:hypothetical protein